MIFVTGPDGSPGAAGEFELVAVAEALARRAHRSQVDKAGEPYIEHPRRVAAGVKDDPVVQAAAWLHDVVEDTSVTLEDLRAAGFPEVVVAAVDALTRRPDEDRDAYYTRVAADPVALQVKWADLADNADPGRLARLDADTRGRLHAKYAHAREVLSRQATRLGE